MALPCVGPSLRRSLTGEHTDSASMCQSGDRGAEPRKAGEAGRSQENRAEWEDSPGDLVHMRVKEPKEQPAGLGTGGEADALSSPMASHGNPQDSPLHRASRSGSGTVENQNVTQTSFLQATF